MKTIKNIAMAIAMTIIGTASTYANNIASKDHSHMPVAVAVVHNNHHHDIHSHRHLNRPMHNCFCKHCKKIRRQMDKARRRHELEMRHHNKKMHRLEAKKHSMHPDVNARKGHHTYVNRH